MDFEGVHRERNKQLFQAFSANIESRDVTNYREGEKLKGFFFKSKVSFFLFRDTLTDDLMELVDVVEEDLV